MLDDQAAARREADALLARALRDRREQGARLPDDAPAERDVPRARRRQPARPARRHPRRIRRCWCISTTARTSRRIRTRTSAASCSSSSRWASATTRERDVREAARAFTGWTNDVLTFKFDADAARLRRQDVPRPDRPVQRRGHHRHHPRRSRSPPSSSPAKLYRFFVRDEMSPRRAGPSSAARSATAAIR